MSKTANVFLLIVFFYSMMPLSAQEQSFVFKPDNSNFYVYGRGSETFIINQSRITGSNIDTLMKQLFSGIRINNAADDPAGLAIAAKMESMLKQLRQSSMNDEDMRNFDNYAESAIAQDQEILNRVRELILRSSNGILASDDKEIIQTEIDELLKQIDMNAHFSRLNTIAVIPDLTVKNLALETIDVIHNSNPAIAVVDAALKKLTRERILKGVRSNILTFRIEGKSWYYINLVESESRIRDMDMAAGISDLIKNSVTLKSQYGLIFRPK
jgi:flagellin